MTYGHIPHAFIEHGPAELLARAAARRSTARSWQLLDEARRLALVERALGAANAPADERRAAA